MCLKSLFGGLCIVTFIASCATCLVGHHDVQAENYQVSTANDQDVSQAWPKNPKEKAVKLQIVWQRNCAPCRRIKVVAVRLIAEGYDIYLTNIDDDPRGATRTPTLRYYLPDGGMIYEEVGFRTAAQIKKYLRK